MGNEAGKLSCEAGNLRPLGRGEVKFPVGFLLGYQLERAQKEQLLDHRGLHLGMPIAQTAGSALELATKLS